MSYQYLCTSNNQIAAIAGLAGSMDSDPEKCLGKSANILHIHGDAVATISYEGGSIFAQSYPSVNEVVQRWSKNNQCTADSDKKLDLIASMLGPETTTSLFSCTKGSLELWTINGGIHVPVLDRGFADQVLQWLINNKSA